MNPNDPQYLRWLRERRTSVLAGGDNHGQIPKESQTNPPTTVNSSQPTVSKHGRGRRSVKNNTK